MIYAKKLSKSILKIPKLFKKYLYLSRIIKIYSLKKKSKSLLGMNLTNGSIYFKLITIFLCINISISIPIVQKANSKEINEIQTQDSTTFKTSLMTTPVPSEINIPILNNFIKNMIHSFDEDDDQQLNIAELAKLLSNKPLLKKFESILNKKHSTFIQKITTITTKSIEPKTSAMESQSIVPIIDPNLKNKENTNLKSNKKSKLQEEFQKEEDDYFGGSEDDNEASQ
ncbi:unnamed protein product [Brachionus calyciflorus]|uniref:EF-hand domain-containing protein n=1 Tax=Brachionus calyciflorus TaxID=104777 RepID=A0A814KB88_9BILA|nr:unnamed protein product [Brachionus calyciflorus]